MCPYCEQDTGGNHAFNCPLNENQKVYYGYARVYPQNNQISVVVGTDKQYIALQQIKDIVDMYTTCEPGQCKDCDLLRQIGEIAKEAMNGYNNALLRTQVRSPQLSF